MRRGGVPERVPGFATITRPDHTESLYIGDSPSDIAASRAAGVAVASAAWAETADAELLRSLHPDLLFTTVEQFRNYIEQISVRQTINWSGGKYGANQEGY